MCPLVFFRDNPDAEDRLYVLHLNWTKGILPEPGGLDDQPAAYPSAMAAVEAGMNAAQEVKMEQTRRDQERKQRHKTAKGKGPRR